MCEKKVIKLSEILEKVPSWDITGVEAKTLYIQCITSQLDDKQKAFLLTKCGAKPVRFKDGVKTRFFLPSDVELMNDLK